MYKLRPYQQDLINQILQSIRTGHKSIVVQSPPRTGKTVVMAEIARRATEKGNRVLFMIHRKEVLEQAVETFHTQRVNESLTKLGMIQTLTRHINKIQPPKLILIDEAHHALSKSYLRVLKAFPDAYVLLFTATPRRTGRRQLGLIADDIVVGQSIKELTSKGFLAPFKYYAPSTDIDAGKLKRSSTGDYTKKSMDEATRSTIYGNAIKNYRKFCNGKQAVVYTYSIDSAKHLAEAFNQASISAKAVSSKTIPEERKQLVRAFRRGKIKILVNVNLFTEGIDLPNVDAVIMCRPTKSLSLYLQFSMRCLNPRPGKTAIIIDQVENWKEFGLPSDDRDWRKALISKAKTTRKSNTGGGPQVVQCPSCFGCIDSKDIKDNTCPLCHYSPVRVQREIDQQESEFELITNAKAAERKRRMKHILRMNIKSEIFNKSVSDLHSLQQFQEYAKAHDYKPGWAWVMWNKKKRGMI